MSYPIRPFTEGMAPAWPAAVAACAFHLEANETRRDAETLALMCGATPLQADAAGQAAYWLHRSALAAKARSA